MKKFGFKIKRPGVVVAPVYFSEDGEYIAVLNPRTLVYNVYKVDLVMTLDKEFPRADVLKEIAKYE